MKTQALYEKMFPTINETRSGHMETFITMSKNKHTLYWDGNSFTKSIDDAINIYDNQGVKVKYEINHILREMPHLNKHDIGYVTKKYVDGELYMITKYTFSKRKQDWIEHRQIV